MSLSLFLSDTKSQNKHSPGSGRH